MEQILDTISDIDNNKVHPEQRSNSRSDTPQSPIDSGIPNTGRVSPVQMKKRTLSKIFSVFTSRSGSVSIPPVVPNNDTPPITPTSPEGNMVQTRAKRSSGKEPIKRAASVVSLFFFSFDES